MDPAAAAQWCTKENGQVELCVVIDVPGRDWTEDQVRQALAASGLSQKTYILDVRTDPSSNRTFVLTEWKKGVPGVLQKEKFQLTKDTEALLVHPDGSSTNPGSSECTISGPEADQQKPSTSSEDSPSQSLATIGPEFFVALGDFLSTCQKDAPPHSETGYRKLRVFSGRRPVPTGEDNFEEWLDQATQALDEWDIPENHKKQRITESLRGPASEAIRNLKLSKKGCVAQDYLSVLQDAFGRTEKVSDLMYQLEHTYQGEGEKLSDYVRRLDKILHQILLKKGIDPRKVDEVRAQQVLRGAQPLDPVAMLLRTRQDGGILKYPDLIRIVRQEEAMLENKRNSRRPESVVGVRMTQAIDSDSEIELLKTQVSQLIEMMASLTARPTAAPDGEVPEPNKTFDTPKSQTRTSTSQGICFNCGGMGHYQWVCPSPARLETKYQKPAGNFRGPR